MLYLKPVQTGFPSDSDARYVYQEVARVGRLHPEAISEGLFISNHTLQVSPAVQRSVRMTNSAWHGQDPSSSVHDTGNMFCTKAFDVIALETPLERCIKLSSSHTFLQECKTSATTSHSYYRVFKLEFVQRVVVYREKGNDTCNHGSLVRQCGHGTILYLPIWQLQGRAPQCLTLWLWSLFKACLWLSAIAPGERTVSQGRTHPVTGLRSGRFWKRQAGLRVLDPLEPCSVIYTGTF